MNLHPPTHRVAPPPLPHQRRTERIERRPATTVRIERSDTVRDDGPPTEPLPRLDPAATERPRLRGVDAARGVALIGMIAVHTLPLTDGAGRSTLVGSVFGGTSAALFGFLAGVSVALLTGRRQVVAGGGAGRRHALRLATRGLVVGALGLLLGDLAAGSVDIILTYYGVLFLLAVPLVFLPTRALFAAGAALMVVAPVTDFLVRAQLAPVELQDPSFGYLVTDPVGLLSTLLFTGAYPAWPWLTYLCLGLAVGRCSLERTRTAATLAVGGVVLAVLAAVVSTALLAAGGAAAIRANPGLPPEGLASALAQGPDGVTPTSTWWWLAVDLPHSATPLFLAYTVGTSLAVLGAMLLLDGALARPGTAARVLGAVRAPLVAAGSMTLTFYTLHVLVSGAAPKAGAGAFLLVQVGVALAVGYLWRTRIGKGPLETAVSTVVDAVGRPPARRDGRATGSRTALVVLAAVVAVLGAVGGAAAVVVTATPPATSVAPSAPEDDEAPTGEDTTPDPGPRPTTDPEDDAPDGPQDAPDAPDAPDEPRDSP